MTTTGHWRRRSGTRQPTRFWFGLQTILRTLTGAVTGQTHRTKAQRKRWTASHVEAGETAQPRSRERIVMRKFSVLRLGVAFVLFLILAGTGWRIVADMVGRSLAESAPADALNWSPNMSVALDQRAFGELRKSAPDVDSARDWLRQSLTAHPLDERALFLLALAAERKGDATGAAALMQEAGRRTWRNLATQLWLFEKAVKRKDFQEALEHADAMFRVEPNFLAPIFPTIAAFTTTPSGLKILAEFLVTAPPWRDWVLISLSDRLYDESRLDQIHAVLLASPSPPTTRELRAYLNRLIKSGRYETAYRTWRQAAADKREALESPYNGNFESPTDGLPFNWSIASIPGADAGIVQAEGSRGKALRIQFSGARVHFAHIEQMMLLPPARYRLAGRVRADNLQTSRGLWWTILCAGASGATLGHTDLVSGSRPWNEFHAEFAVPDAGCKAQILRLELPARIAPEQQIDGQVWYQDLRIAPAAPGKISGE